MENTVNELISPQANFVHGITSTITASHKKRSQKVYHIYMSMTNIFHFIKSCTLYCGIYENKTILAKNVLRVRWT